MGKWKYLMLVLLAAVLVVGVLFFILPSNKSVPAQSSNSEISTFTSSNSNKILNRAEKGKLIEGFPAELIPDKKANLGDSYEEANPNPDTKLLISHYISKTALKDLHGQYLKYFKDREWTINIDNVSDSQFSIAALKADQTININAFQIAGPAGSADSVSVTVNFNTKK